MWLHKSNTQKKGKELLILNNEMFSAYIHLNYTVRRGNSQDFLVGLIIFLSVNKYAIFIKVDFIFAQGTVSLFHGV